MVQFSEDHRRVNTFRFLIAEPAEICIPSTFFDGVLVCFGAFAGVFLTASVEHKTAYGKYHAYLVEFFSAAKNYHL